MHQAGIAHGARVDVERHHLAAEAAGLVGGEGKGHHRAVHLAERLGDRLAAAAGQFLAERLPVAGERVGDPDQQVVAGVCAGGPASWRTPPAPRRWLSPRSAPVPRAASAARSPVKGKAMASVARPSRGSAAPLIQGVSSMCRGHACNLAPETNPGNLLLVMSSRPGPSPPLFLLLGILTGLGSVAGAWSSAARWEREVRDQNDAALARTAAAYIGVVTPPAPDGGVDARRLVSSATPSRARRSGPVDSRWRSELSRSSRTPSAWSPCRTPRPWRSSAGSSGSSLPTPAFGRCWCRSRAGPARVPAGGLLPWNTLPLVLSSRLTVLLTLFALAGPRGRPAHPAAPAVPVGRRRALLAGLGVPFLIWSLEPGLEYVRQAAKNSTAVRLRMARRLIEIAATAGGVQPGAPPGNRGESRGPRASNHR